MIFLQHQVLLHEETGWKFDLCNRRAEQHQEFLFP